MYCVFINNPIQNKNEKDKKNVGTATKEKSTKPVISSNR